MHDNANLLMRSAHTCDRRSLREFFMALCIIQWQVSFAARVVPPASVCRARIRCFYESRQLSSNLRRRDNENSARRLGAETSLKGEELDAGECKSACKGEFRRPFDYGIRSTRAFVRRNVRQSVRTNDELIIGSNTCNRLVKLAAECTSEILDDLLQSVL